MKRSELIDQMYEGTKQLSLGHAEQAVQTLLACMTQALAQGQRIEIRGFGSFSAVSRKARLGRNPKSGQPVQVQAKRLPHFKQGKALKTMLCQPKI